MLVLIEFILLLFIFGGLAFFTNADGQVIIFEIIISPVVLGIVFMVFGMLFTFPIFFRQASKYRKKIRNLKSTGKEAIKENKTIKKEIAKENKAAKKDRKNKKKNEKEERGLQVREN